MSATRLLPICLLALVACRSSDNKQQEPKIRSAAVTPSLTAEPPTTPETEAQKKEDKKKGDKSDEEWIPAEFKSGAARWKDTGVYLDGKPIGFLAWGELPIGLKPVWFKDKMSATKRPGTKDLGWRWGQQRRYRVTDYLAAMGVDIKKLKEVHIYGPKYSNSVVFTSKDLQEPLAKELTFRFGSNVSGKAIPMVPQGLGHGHPPDKLASIMIYVEKTPPVLTDDGFKLDNNLVEGVPYHGEPLRGGIRIYLDNRYAAMIKRQELDPKKATKAANGELQWSLAEFLSSQGVDTSKVVELWVVRDEKREEKFPASEITGMSFQASAQAKGGVLLTDKLIRANAIALHTQPVTPEMLPITTSDDD